jgi:hypothetical protein
MAVPNVVWIYVSDGRKMPENLLIFSNIFRGYRAALWDPTSAPPPDSAGYCAPRPRRILRPQIPQDTAPPDPAGYCVPWPSSPFEFEWFNILINDYISTSLVCGFREKKFFTGKPCITEGPRIREGQVKSHWTCHRHLYWENFKLIMTGNYPYLSSKRVLSQLFIVKPF